MMNKKIFLKPNKPGLIVRNPINGLPLPASGLTVELNSYWRRRLRDGDVVELRQPKQLKQKTKPTVVVDNDKKD